MEDPLRRKESLGGRYSSASNDHTPESLSGFNSPDGLEAPEDYCKQVFALCDPEDKGYITRDTLSRFCDRRNSVLDSIMSTLDHDNDGKISFDEFREGFEAYSHDFLLAHGAHIPDHEVDRAGGDEEEPILTNTNQTVPQISSPVLLPVAREEDVWESEGVRDRGGEEKEEEEEDKWAVVAEKIDPEDLLRETEVGKVWSELASRDPGLLEHFERFLSGVTAELKQSQHDKEKLQTHMKRAMDQHNREVMEMEDLLEQHLSEVHEDHQIKSANRTQQLSSRFHALLAARDQVIHQLVDKEDCLKRELQNKSRTEEMLMEEREGLLKANNLLKDQLDNSLRSLSLSRRAIKKGLHRAAMEEHQDYSPRNSMVSQPPSSSSSSRPVPNVSGSGSSPVHYFPPKKSPRRSSPTGMPRSLSRELLETSDHTHSNKEPSPSHPLTGEPSDDPFTEERREGEGEPSSSLNPYIEGFESRPPSRVLKTTADTTRDNLQRELDPHHHSPSPARTDPFTAPPSRSRDHHVTQATPTSSSAALSNLTDDIMTYSAQASRGTGGVGDNSEISVSQSLWLPQRGEGGLHPPPPSTTSSPSSSLMTVNRVFKVVFLGNSGVGKTSLILRVSQGQFSPVSSTLGLDFSTKTLVVGNERVVFQLWDTAGQERFHNALTSVYFRRADAFVIVYDVTNKASFKSVRSWLSIITASLREHPPVLMLVGNKCDSTSDRKVSSEEGRLLALDLHAMFSEMSALSGTNVLQGHQTLANLLLARENEELEKARKASLNLSSQAQKRRCYC